MMLESVWWRLTVVTKNMPVSTEYIQEIISGIVSEFHSDGLEICDDLSYVYFTDKKNAEDAARSLMNYFNDSPGKDGTPGSIQTEIDSITGHNWQNEWKTFFSPVTVSDTLTIIQPWGEYKATTGEIVITINPQQAFGTGLHESTRLLLRIMEKHKIAGKNILDVGTGTGIAAIYALKRGARHATAIDIEEAASVSAAEHAVVNGVARNLDVVQNDILNYKNGTFDIVMVNIEWSILKKVLPHLPRFLDESALLLISGIQYSERNYLRTALKKMNFRYGSIIREADWASLAAWRTGRV